MFSQKFCNLWLLLFSLLIMETLSAAPPHHPEHPPHPVKKCTHPAKRREWRQLSRREKTDWVKAVLCLANTPHDTNLKQIQGELNMQINASSSYYDDWVYVHLDNNRIVHHTGRFLPWHRWYVNAYEQALTAKCGYRGVSPYWDWTLDADNIREASIWKDADPEHGLGGFGDPLDGFKVKDGAFGESSSFRVSYPIPHVLRRNYTLYPYLNHVLPELIPDSITIQANSTFTKERIYKLVHSYRGNFTSFQRDFEYFAGSHASVHFVTGGDFGGQCPEGTENVCRPGAYFSANEPMFWLHHAMVDKVWYDWQNAYPENKKAFSGGATLKFLPPSEYEKYPNGAEPWLTMDDLLPSNGLAPETTIGNVMSTTEGDLCYIYV